MSLLSSFTRTPAQVAAQLANAPAVALPFISGRNYNSSYVTGAVANATAALTAGRLYCMPLWTGPGGISIASFQCNVTSGSAGNARMGAYQAHPTTGLPNALIIDAGTFDTSGTGTGSVTSATTLTGIGPWYIVWLAILTDATPTLSAYTAAAMPLFGGSPNGVNYNGIYMTQSYGALPATFTQTSVGTVGPILSVVKA